MANEAHRQAALLRQVLNHIDAVLVYPERRQVYPCTDAQHANFSPSVELHAADNLRVSVGLARHYAAQHLNDGDAGLQNLRDSFEGSGFIIRQEHEQIAIVGQHFVIDQIEPCMQACEDTR